MPRSPQFEHGISRGQIREWPEGVGTPAELAEKVTFTGNAKHKTYPSPAGPPAHRADAAKCGPFSRHDWPRLRNALQDAIRAGCVAEFRGDYPSRVWVWINGVLHEGR